MIKENRSTRLSGWLCVMLVAAGWLAAGCEKIKSQFSKTSPLEFRVDTVVRTNLIQSVTANGQILPTRQVQVGSQISGIITEMKVDYNSQVKAGDVLAKIDPATYERALAQADANLASAKSQLEIADYTYKQDKELFGKKLISESDYITAKVNYDQAVAGVKMRDAAVESAKVDLQRTTIYSPITGMVISRAVDAGQTVAASFSTPTMFQIAEDLHKMQIQLAVSEADIGNVKDRQRVDFTVDAYPGQKFSGDVTQVRFEPTTNQNVVTYTIVVEITNEDLKLRPGMTATASIVTSEKKDVLRVSSSALRFSPPALATVLPATNTVSTNDVRARPNRYGNLPTPPWAAEGRRPAEGEREKWLATLTPEQQKQAEDMRKRFQQMRDQGGGGGPGGGGGGPGGGGGGGGPGGGGGGGMGMMGMGGGPGGGAPRRDVNEGPTVKTVYIPVDTKGEPGAKPTVQAVVVKIGISDALGSEVLEGLSEGVQVAIGTKGGPVASTTQPNSNPLGGGGGFFGGGRR